MKANLDRVKIIRRGDLEVTPGIKVGEHIESLGVHKDFRRNPLIKQYLPENARLSMAWVHLGLNERLNSHSHPTISIIVVASGNGRTFGDLESDFREGDIILIPPGCEHGFVGAGLKGYWALSIQVEGQGLYENVNNPRVVFSENAQLKELIALNEKYMKAHQNNILYNFIQSRQVRNDKKRARLLDAIQVWSNFYQKMVNLRYALTDARDHAHVAEEHLSEEFRHNVKLATDRGDKLREIWDPVLEAASSWFTWKMLTSDDVAKACIVHLVLEGSSTIFHKLAHPIMAQFNETDHFGVHDEADEAHYEMGLSLMYGLTATQFDLVKRNLREGWDMLNLVCTRMVELTNIEIEEDEVRYEVCK